jgi:hypothetical protein
MTTAVLPNRNAEPGTASKVLAVRYHGRMATLYLRNVPEEIDVALATEADERGMSKNRRAIEVLRRGLGMDRLERVELVDEIRRERARVSGDVAAMIRADRPGGDI